MTCTELEIPEWSAVQRRDRLLGCSLTGWQDMVNAVGLDRGAQIALLKDLRAAARGAAKEYAEELGTEEPLLVTTVKPEGTLSLLPVVSSGVHFSHAPYYVRRIRISAHDPLVKVCEELGYPVYPEVGQSKTNATVKVVEFPVKAPEGKIKRDVSAIEQLEIYKMFMEHYVDHNCSITVHVREDEWEAVEQWVWDNWDDVVGITFLSLDDSFYDLLPFEEITRQEYEQRQAAMKPFIPSLIAKYEREEVAYDIGNDGCEGGVCPVR
jgi:ribonucleoside-diphosphate reductase alpha chain/ribonucleoside-triphosphate reductase